MFPYRASDDGTCRIWDARDSTINARIYAPKLEIHETGKYLSWSLQDASNYEPSIFMS